MECNALQVGNNHEPLFGILALYDLKSKKRISENFHFDFNPDDIHKMLEAYQPVKEVSSTAKLALFQVRPLSPFSPPSIL